MLKKMSRARGSSARISGNILRPALANGCFLISFEGRPLTFSLNGSLLHHEISANKTIKFYPFPVRYLKDTSRRVATDEKAYLS